MSGQRKNFFHRTPIQDFSLSIIQKVQFILLFFLKQRMKKKYVDGMAKMEFSHFSKRNAFSINFSVLCWIEQICFFPLLLTNFLEAISVRFNSNLIVTKQKLRDCHKNFQSAHNNLTVSKLQLYFDRVKISPGFFNWAEILKGNCATFPFPSQIVHTFFCCYYLKGSHRIFWLKTFCD